jgi:hypothetical protein
MTTTHKWRIAALGAMAAVCGAAGMAAEGAAELPSAPVQAVWKSQTLIFNYQSFSTFYSCESLEEKLEQILRQVGAEVVVRVRSADCGRGPVRMPRAEIQIVSPVEATPEVMAELKKGETHRELIARIRGNRAEAAAATEQFPAQWQRVHIGRGRGTLNLEAGDCELVEQVRRRILPQLAVRVVEHDTPCPPNSPGFTRPKLVVDALIEMPKPDDVEGKRR